MPGLKISADKSSRTIKPILTVVSLVILGLCMLFGWWWWQYYSTGVKPPISVISNLIASNSTPDVTPVTDSQRAAHQVGPTEPRFISIPQLKIEKVRVFSVGLSSDGSMDAPRNINDAAWFNQSSKPGSGNGVVLIDAHSGGDSMQGIFVKLYELSNGSTIKLERGDGKIINYKVVENKTESLSEANKSGMKRILTPYTSDKEGLGLITCTGKYIPKIGQYDKRVLVRAVYTGAE